MYSILTKEFHQADAVPWQPTDSEDEDDQEFERKKFQGNKELTGNVPYYITPISFKLILLLILLYV